MKTIIVLNYFYLLANFAICYAGYFVVQRIAFPLTEVRPGTVFALFDIILSMAFEVERVYPKGHSSELFCSNAELSPIL